MTTTFVTLFKAFAVGMMDYMAKHNANYSTIETNLNQIFSMLTGQAGGDMSVPRGLQEIFDRKGLIGAGAYDFSEGVIPGDVLGVGAGAYWSGTTFLKKASSSNLSLAGIPSGTVYVYLDAAGNPALSAAVQPDTVRQFAWNSGTHTVSAKAVQAGVAFLFDGDDYADCLTSEALAATYPKLADRLEAIEQLLGAMTGYYAFDHMDGLDFHHKAGKVRNDSSVTDTAAGHVALTDNATNYVEVDPTTGVVSKGAGGFTSGKIPLFQVGVVSGEATVVDKRTWAVAGTGGGGGGHTQNTDVGTTATDFELDRDAVGHPTGRSGVKVNNGDDPDGLLQFNRDAQKWEFSNDGGATWRALGDADLGLGAQELTKYVPQEDPPLVFSEDERGPSMAYEPIDLTAYVGTPMFGVQAVALRVFFRDTEPGPGVKVMFKKGGSGYAPVTAFSVWADESDSEQKAADLIVPIAPDNTVEFFVLASGVATASIAVYMLGLFEKVMGVGTQEKAVTQSNLTVAAGATVDSNIIHFVDRGLAHYLKVEETGGALTGTYNIELYAKDTFLAADLLYKATGIDPSVDYEDWVPFWVYDSDLTRELHLRIVNNDAAHQGVFSVTLKAEQFA